MSWNITGLQASRAAAGLRLIRIGLLLARVGAPLAHPFRSASKRGHARALLAALALLHAADAAAADLADVFRGVRWSEPGNELLADLGGRAVLLPQAIDFGDSYAEIVRRDITAGGVPLITFFQMDNRTGGLKRIQLERQRHGVNPPAFRAVFGALAAMYGAPGAACAVPPGPAGGYQAAAESVWRLDGFVVRAIFRDTTIEAFEGCLSGDPSVAGPCGLTGQLLVRISPEDGGGAGCPTPPR